MSVIRPAYCADASIGINPAQLPRFAASEQVAMPHIQALPPYSEFPNAGVVKFAVLDDRVGAALGKRVVPLFAFPPAIRKSNGAERLTAAYAGSSRPTAASSNDEAELKYCFWQSAMAAFAGAGALNGVPRLDNCGRVRRPFFDASALKP
jgi:hypothetical protein